MERQNNRGIEERWENYRLANSRFPRVREIELSKQLEMTSPLKGETIVEVGTGNGYLTFELAKAVAPNGKVRTYDYQKSNTEFVNKNNAGLPIIAVNQSLDYNLDLEEGAIDKISTLATLHHYDDRSKKTGINGRTRAFQEFYRVLKNEGKLIIADVAQDTSTQRYFDSIDNPVYCSPIGHPHDFLDETLARALCSKVGFRDLEFKIERVPWVFDNEEQASGFLHTIHNAKCSPKESLEHAKKTLPYWTKNDKFYLSWELFYLIAKK